MGRRALWMLVLGGALASGLSAAPELPAGWDRFRLGMDLASLKTALTTSGSFLYRGDAEVTLLNTPNTHLIDVPGTHYLARGVFQLTEGRLSSLALEFNREEFDYFALYATLEAKYGPPTGLDPDHAWWENDRLRLSLERPVTLKYLDLEVWRRLQAAGRANAAVGTVTRDTFLGTF